MGGKSPSTKAIMVADIPGEGSPAALRTREWGPSAPMMTLAVRDSPGPGRTSGSTLFDIASSPLRSSPAPCLAEGTRVRVWPSMEATFVEVRSSAPAFTARRTRV